MPNPHTVETDKYYFDERAANAAVNFIEEHVKHIKGPLSGKPFILEEWQKDDIIYPLFGIKEKETGLRRYKFAYIEIPKKNGKSPILSAIIIYTLLFEKDEGAEIYSAASTRDQAKIVFGDACKMIKKDSWISSQLQVYQNSVLYGNKSYRPLSADIGANDGINANLVCFDELHRQPNRLLYDVLIGSTASKEQPLFVMITTAGNDFNSICFEQHEYAIKVRDGIIKDDRYLPVIYAADKNDDPFIESTWKKANPNYGISVRKDFIQEQAEKARTNAAYLNTFLRLHLNIWTNVETVWIRDEIWQDAAAKLDINQLKGETAFGGLDLSSTSDITAFTLIFPPSERDYYPDKYLSFNWVWLPEEKGRDSADKNNNNYLQWLKDGHIVETEGNVIDYAYIEGQILSICSDFQIGNFAFDPYNSAQIASRLEEQGLPMYAHRQGFVSMNFPTKQLEVVLGKKTFLHDDNPVLRWMVSNAVLKTNTEGNLCKIDKNQAHQKIDGVVTNIMALGMAIEGEDNSEGSYLDDSEMMYVDL